MVTYKFPAKHLNIQRTDLIKKNPDPGATNSSSQISYSQLTVKIFAGTRPSGKLYFESLIVFSIPFRLVFRLIACQFPNQDKNY